MASAKTISVSNALEVYLRCFISLVNPHAIKIPKPAPYTSCAKIIYTISGALVSAVMMVIIIAVSIYEQGSLLPLSISSIEAVLYFSPRFFDLRMEKTDAASVELRTEPIRKLNLGSIPRTSQQKSPVTPAVIRTPIEASRPALSATGRACFQLVPKPP